MSVGRFHNIWEQQNQTHPAKRKFQMDEEVLVKLEQFILTNFYSAVCRKSLFAPIKSDVFTNLSMKKTSQNKRTNIFTNKYQYFADCPFIFKIAANLRGMESTRLRHISLEILYHIFCICFQNSSACTGSKVIILFFMICHKFSIGLSSIGPSIRIPVDLGTSPFHSSFPLLCSDEMLENRPMTT